MSEYADKHSNPHRKARVEHILRTDPKAKIDASGYTPPDALNAEEKTGPCKPKPRAYAKGGKVEGEKAHRHAGRKSRDAGGLTAVQQLRPVVPTSGIYGSGFSPTHAGMASTAAGLKKGGGIKRRDSGGEAVQQARANRSYRDAHANAVNTYDKSLGVRPSVSGDDARAAAGKASAAMGNMYDSADRTGYPPQLRSGGEAKKRADGGKANWIESATKNKGALHRKLHIPAGEKIPEKKLEKAEHAKSPTERKEAQLAETLKGMRHKRADGGRTKAKGKMNVNIIIAQKPESQPPVPPPPSAIPPGMPMPKPGLPPAAMGAMTPPMGPGMPGAAPGASMPAQMPAGLGPR